MNSSREFLTLENLYFNKTVVPQTRVKDDAAIVSKYEKDDGRIKVFS